MTLGRKLPWIKENDLEWEATFDGKQMTWNRRQQWIEDKLNYNEHNLIKTNLSNVTRETTMKCKPPSIQTTKQTNARK